MWCIMRHVFKGARKYMKIGNGWKEEMVQNIKIHLGEKFLTSCVAKNVLLYFQQWLGLFKK